jgi:hypothetical protein
MRLAGRVFEFDGLAIARDHVSNRLLLIYAYILILCVFQYWWPWVI